MLVWYGTGDVLVPAAHGAWLAAHVPGCAVLIDDSGHLGSDPVPEISANQRWLRYGELPANASAPN